MNENKCRTMELESVKSRDGFLVYFSVLNRMGRKPETSGIGLIEEEKCGNSSS